MNTGIDILENANKVLKAVFDYYKDGFFVVDFEAIVNDKEPVKIPINDNNRADKVLTQADYQLLPRELISEKNVFIETILYLYGIWLYKKLTGQNYEYTLNSDLVKIPGVFQLLSSILEENYTKREANYYILKNYIQIALDELKNDFFQYVSTDEFYLEGYSSVGLLRDENQDSFGWFQDAATKSLLLIVADGMGGGDFGKEASQIAINIFKQEFETLCKKSYDEIDEYLKDIILRINNTIRRIIKNKNIRSMGTTVSAVFIKNNKVFFVHVGDSRIYIKYKDEENFNLISQDHSFAEVEYRKGNITKEEKEKYKKNILAFIVGSKNLTRDVINTTKDYGDINLKDIDNIIICCDGVWDLINDNNEFKDDVKTIYKKLNSRITHDNHTIIKLGRKKIENLREKDEKPIVTKVENAENIEDKKLSYKLLASLPIIFILIIISVITIILINQKRQTKVNNNENFQNTNIKRNKASLNNIKEINYKNINQNNKINTKVK